ncbi:MAG: mechanosensitive ion channel family protein [Candidatus Omnitrophota bacterium]
MNLRFAGKKVLFLSFFVILACFFSCGAFSQEGKTSGEKTTEANAILKEQRKEEIEELKKQEKQTKTAIQEKAEEVKAAEETLEKVKEKKETEAKEDRLKETQLIVAQAELEAAKKKAEATKEAGAQKEVKKLEEEVKKLEKEVVVEKKETEEVEKKEQLILQATETNKAKIDELKKALIDLKAQKSARLTLREKIILSGIAIIIGVILFLLLKLVLKQVERAISKKEVLREDEFTLRVKTFNRLINWLGGFVITGTVIYIVLDNFGMNLAPLLAGAGIVGIAFGFGGQYLIRDLINGLFILLEGQYRIKDVVKIGEYGGLVEDINLRITTLRDLAGRVIIIPNGEVKTVVNFTREYAQALLNIGVAYKENVDRVMDVIKEIGKEMRQDPYFGKLIIGDLEMLGVDDFADSQVTIKFRIKTLPIKQWEVSREFRRRLKNRFDELDIEIPFPHRILYMGTGADNDWLRKFAEELPKKPQ